jgi:hypothetical protein
MIYDSVTLASGAMKDAISIMNSLTSATAANASETGALAIIQNGLATVFETVAVLGVNLKFTLSAIGKEIGGLAAQAAAFLSGNFAQAAEIGRMMRNDAAAARREVDSQTRAILGARKLAATAGGMSASDAAAQADADANRRALAAEEKARDDAKRRAAAAAAAASAAATAATRAQAAAEKELADIRRNDLAVGAERNKQAEENFKIHRCLEKHTTKKQKQNFKKQTKNNLKILNKLR